MMEKCSNMETTAIQTKLKLLFEKMTESGYVVNNYYADSVINKLSSKTDPETQWLEKSPILSDLLIKALESTESSHITVKVFIIRVLATISSNELHFGKIFTKENDYITNAFRSIDSNNMTPSLKVAFMEVALGIATHNSGVTWLLQTEVWKNILNLSSEKQTVFVVRQTYKFANIFLWQLNDMNDKDSLTNVLNVVLKPLITNLYADITSMSSEEEEVHNKSLEPMLQIILSLFKNNKRFGQKTLLLSHLINNYSTISSLCATLDILHTVSMTTLIAKVIFWLHVAKVFFIKPLKEDTKFKKHDVMEMSVVYFNIAQHFIKRRLPVAVLDFCIDCSIIWSKIWPEKGPTMETTNGDIIEIQSQLVVIPLCPIICYIFSNQCPADTAHWLHDNNILKDYICKLLEYSCEHTIRAAYSMRDLMREVEMSSVVVQSLKRLSCLKNDINNHQANLIFQALFHCLKNFTPVDECGVPRPPELYEDTQLTVIIMTYIMETVLILLKYFNINWQDSIEVLCLYNVVSDIIKRPNLSCRFLVTSLKVIAVTVRKFQPPNLSLLVDSTPGSAINELGSMIYMRLHERHWEIRDSALELMLVCTEISFIKFPPFQKQIKDNNLIDMAAVMALNDPEVYVQASALKCIGAATKLFTIWEQLMTSQPDIQEKLLNLLRHNDEGIVRKEAANVLCDMYINLKLTPDFKSTLHRHMTSAALADFHWEVQLAALRFWKEAIQTALSEQGMLDGTFPAVTFAKESRKIVTLNDKEIQKRLVKCLEELSSIGCLTVLSVLLDEDTETEIMNAALTVSLDLLEILNKYKVPEVLIASEHDKALFCEIVEEIKGKREPSLDEDVEFNDAGKSESVIEGILNSTDLNLLANIYENQLTIQKDVGKIDVKPKLVLQRLVTPAMFVYLLNSKDFKEIIDSKRKWERGIRSLSSLLDDVLGIYEYNDEVNAMDCY